MTAPRIFTDEDVYNWRLPAGKTIGFEVSFPRRLPEKQYARHTVCVFSAVDGRQRF